ncbi:class I SAM-dependent methyltransferase [Erysipelothrix urinaevulpis]|uniref:class I SAM-dependent methyltransferase n=1 Tax=Erysipelothrix urinaevulpis TaxID=2683717 RepID=UPI0013594816|nr:class I SAM-dependent methyltransferase [Erysipelothrix urinaevulpis]
MLKNTNWKDYEILALEKGFKVERFGEVILKRPEPLAQNKKRTSIPVDSTFIDNHWSHPITSWTIQYKDLKFTLETGKFKHVGIFPEQADNWDFLRHCLRKIPNAKVLNLFGYTGAATIACAKESPQEIVHVDALKSTLETAQKNAQLNQVDDQFIRYINDDAIKFLEREARRERNYQGIVMDPPSFGRGPKGEMWKITEQLPTLIDLALDRLQVEGEFLVINTYSTNLSKYDVRKLLIEKLEEHNLPINVKSYDLSLPIKDSTDVLRAGQTVRWARQKHLL